MGYYLGCGLCLRIPMQGITFSDECDFDHARDAMFASMRDSMASDWLQPLN